MDMQLDHTVGAAKAAQKSEMDSKALNDRPGAVGLGRNMQSFGGATKLPMESVKEDAERENSVSEVKAKTTPSDPNQSVARQISEAMTKKYAMTSQLKRMKESKNYMNMK